MTMHSTLRSISAAVVAVCSLLVLTPPAFAESDAVPTMAGIVAELNHFPSPEQKQTLAAIRSNEGSSTATVAIADAIYNVEHKAQADGVAQLKAVVASDSASADEKELAKVVLKLNHTASDEAQETLRSLAQQ